MTVPDISGKAIANLGYEDIKHLYPVFLMIPYMQKQK